MADEENVADAPSEQGGGMIKMLMFGAAGIVLVAIGILAGPAVMNMVSPPEEAAGEEGGEEAVDLGKPAIYQGLEPPMVVNFKDSYGEQHFMQVTLEVMSRDQDVINAVREHLPAIRSALILLFSSAEYESVTTPEGKQQLLDEALTQIRDVMTERTGEPGIEEVYFTALVIQ